MGEYSSTYLYRCWHIRGIHAWLNGVCGTSCDVCHTVLCIFVCYWLGTEYGLLTWPITRNKRHYCHSFKPLTFPLVFLQKNLISDQIWTKNRKHCFFLHFCHTLSTLIKRNKSVTTSHLLLLNSNTHWFIDRFIDSDIIYSSTRSSPCFSKTSHCTDSSFKLLVRLKVRIGFSAMLQLRLIDCLIEWEIDWLAK